VNSSYHHRVAVLAELGGSTSSQLSSASSAVLVPVGSTEQHGPHLPLDTDTRIATAVARAVAVRLGAASAPGGERYLVAPAIAYGDSGEHQSFAGTISIGTEALTMLLDISPADVLTDRWCAGNGAPLAELLPSMRRAGVAAVSEVGVLGDATTATAAEGSRIFAEMVDACARRISNWAPGPDGMLG
jgi:creatinine amidohydrolase/Fe(II)-dependent formamide hydrolase-like protein